MRAVAPAATVPSSSLLRVLGCGDAFMIGMATIIGAGVFVLTGTAARDFAG